MEANFKQTVARNTLSFGLLTNLKVAFNFLGFLILARLLEPSVFGEVALAASIVALIFILTSWGEQEQIVQESSLKQARQIGTAAFWFKLGISFAILGLLAALFPILAQIYSQEVAIFILVLAGGQALGVTAGTFRAFLQRKLLMFRMGLIEAGVALLSVLAGVGLALAGWGVWALLVFYLIPLVLGGLSFILISPFRPQIKFNKNAFKRLFRFGRNIFGSMATARARDQGDDFIIGSMLGAGPLGIYVLAYRLARSFHQLIVGALLPSLLPTFAKIKQNANALKNTFEYALRNIFRLAFPFYLALGIFTPQAIELVFGTQWLEAVPIFQLIIPFGLLFPIFSLSIHFRYALGEPQQVFKTQILSLTVFLLTLPLLIILWGLKGAALSLDITLLFAAWHLARPVFSQLKIRPIKQLGPALLASLLAAGLTLGLTQLDLTSEIYSLLEKAVPAGLFFLLTYAAALLILEKKSLRADWESLKTALLKNQ
jgi:PST family polysaccharide transporter